MIVQFQTGEHCLNGFCLRNSSFCATGKHKYLFEGVVKEYINYQQEENTIIHCNNNKFRYVEDFFFSKMCMYSFNDH